MHSKPMLHVAFGSLARHNARPIHISDEPLDKRSTVLQLQIKSSGIFDFTLFVIVDSALENKKMKFEPAPSIERENFESNSVYYI
jgi:hypothetical protein